MVIRVAPTWTGKAYSGFGNVTFGVRLDKSSTLALTGTTKLLNFTSGDEGLDNVAGNGFDLEYDGKAVVNKWLKGRTIS